MSAEIDATKGELMEKMDDRVGAQSSVVVPQVEATIDFSANLQITDLPSKYTRERPVLVLVGPEKQQYFVHRSLLAAKSPFFRTMFKECWDGNRREVELTQIPSDGFGIVVDWMYSGRLPDRAKEYPNDGSKRWDSVLHAYKAADVLMIDKLQNELIATEAAILLEHKLTWKFRRLEDLYNADLCHTKYYQFVLKSVIVNMMSNLDRPSEKWEEEIKSVEDNPRVLADLLTSTREWLRKPWKDFPKGDLNDFFVQDAHVQPNSPLAHSKG